MSKRPTPARAAAPTIEQVPITLIGHPYAPIGMGEQMRSHVAALASLRLQPMVFDIYRYAARTDPAHEALVGPREIAAVPDGVRIFHVNGDEVAQVLDSFAAQGNRFEGGINVVVPAWELPRYPEEWAAQLRRFDAVWALSSFIQGSLATAGLEAPLVGQSVEPAPGPLLPRRHFGLRESAFVLMNFFDLTSHATRKNPEAVLDLFARLQERHPFADLQLVLKVKDGQSGAEAWARDWLHRNGARSGLVVIDTALDTLATRSLIACCDCFVSLHRSEGFGRGLGEAMALGRLALGTGWSGNTDFMTADNALPVNHCLIKLGRHDYPHAKGQSWAEPDVAHAAALLEPVLADPQRGRARALRGQAEVLLSHGNRAVGLRLVAEIERLLARPKRSRA